MRLKIRLHPKAHASRIDGCETLEDGSLLIRCRVTAAPEKGKANAALIALLAGTWRIPKSAIALVGGDTDRNKVVEISPPARPAVARWLDESSAPAGS